MSLRELFGSIMWEAQSHSMWQLTDIEPVQLFGYAAERPLLTTGSPNKLRGLWPGSISRGPEVPALRREVDRQRIGHGLSTGDGLIPAIHDPHGTERLFGTLNTELLPELPGYIAHGQLATPAKLALT